MSIECHFLMRISNGIILGEVSINYHSTFPISWSIKTGGQREISSITLAFYDLIIIVTAAAAAAKSRQSCLTLRDPLDGSPPGSPVPGILQARTLEWVAISFSNAWKWKVKVKLLSLSGLMDCGPPGSSIHWIFQVRVLEWGAIAFSKLLWLENILFQIL